MHICSSAGTQPFACTTGTATMTSSRLLSRQPRSSTALLPQSAFALDPFNHVSTWCLTLSREIKRLLCNSLVTWRSVILPRKQEISKSAPCYSPFLFNEENKCWSLLLDWTMFFVQARLELWQPEVEEGKNSCLNIWSVQHILKPGYTYSPICQFKRVPQITKPSRELKVRSSSQVRVHCLTGACPLSLKRHTKYFKSTAVHYLFCITSKLCPDIAQRAHEKHSSS